ncbi:hypothetical protein AZI98_08850 [Aeribacillus pallidus]|uniref:DUF3383 domain-containing protein n=1 Tax=Aeribacillus pallidus TaxID=33936 RepID=A0A161Y3E1_9BACI|nr:DUF3383 family protein [Aeribacillus pallidus]KZN96162.1 hypothetical protein AZI98_08850 [Aeribacillus pallidus]
MPLQDVTVTIDIQKPSGVVGLGKPLILTERTGLSSYKSYADIDAVKVDFPESTTAYKKAAAIFLQKNRPAEIAIATYDPAGAEPMEAVDALSKYFDEDWYFLIATTADEAEQLELADYIETQGFKMFAVQITDKENLSAFKNYDRTITFYHPIANEHADAALVGGIGSMPVGSVTWKFKELKGISPISITKSELNEIHSYHSICYVTKAGRPQTSEGTVGSGEYIDVIHGKDWIKVELETRIQQLMSNTNKLPYDNRGINALESVTLEVLQLAYQNGIIAENAEKQPLYSTNFLSREEVNAMDRSNRRYNGGSFQFELAGAIHLADIKGVIIA